MSELISNPIRTKATFVMGALGYYSGADFRAPNSRQPCLSVDNVVLVHEDRTSKAIVSFSECRRAPDLSDGFGTMTVFPMGASQEDHLSVELSPAEWQHLLAFRIGSPACTVELVVVGGAKEPPDEIIGGFYSIKMYSLGFADDLLRATP